MPHFRTFDHIHYNYQGGGIDANKPDTFEFAETIGGANDPAPHEPDAGQTPPPQPKAPDAEDTFFFTEITKTTFDPPAPVQDEDIVI